MPLKKILASLLGKKAKLAEAAAADGHRSANRMVPLREAARTAYDEADGTTFPVQRSKSEEERLANMATYLVNHAVIFGIEPPGEEVKRIPAAAFAKGSFRDGGNAFRRHGQAADTYVGLSVLENDLRAVIRKMCAGG